MTDEKTLVHTVNDAHNVRLDRWLRREYETLHQGMIEKLVRQGKIRVNGNKVTSSYRLQNDQKVTIPIFITRLPKKDLEKSVEHKLSLTQEDLQALESWTLWEDAELLVLNKPHGLAVQGGSKTAYHLDGLLKALGDKNKCTYRLVHRLDKDTSGVFLVAKTAATAAHLAEAFRLGLHEKVYWALVIGFASPGQGKIDDRLIKGFGGTSDKEKVRVDPKIGQTALTHYRTLKKLAKKPYPELTYLELRPLTGRTHQLRVHCAHKGFPILGDGKYGGSLATQDHKKLHLHARSISIKDSHGNNLTFVAPPPDYFEETVRTYDIDWTQF